MDRGGCQMNGGGGGPDRHGMITLEDLESFSEDQRSDSGNGSLEEEGETMEEEQDPDRLLHYWQEVARGHQVEVAQVWEHALVPRFATSTTPRNRPGSWMATTQADNQSIPHISKVTINLLQTDMAEPIQQLTSNNKGQSQREHIPFTLITRKEKCGQLLYEKRHYEKGHWACITMQEDTYEQSICYGFMKIMRYICQQNTLGEYLGMTLPIVTVVRTSENHSVISRDVTVAYYLPIQHQAQPPQPHDNEITIEIWPAAIVYTRPFTGPTNEVVIINQINTMAELLDSPGVGISDSFIVAGYTNPAHSNRQNEIWFLERR